MNRIRTLFSTTAFKVLLAYLLVFVAFAFFVLGWLRFATERFVTDQMTETIEADVRGLAEQFRIGGVRRLVGVIDQRTRSPGSSLYLVTTFSGETVVGNVSDLPPGTLSRQGWVETVYRPAGAFEGVQRRALVQVYGLPAGFRLLVGRDLEERERVRQIFGRGLRLSITVAVVLGLIGAYFVTRRVLKRVDAMTGMASRIMAGDLAGRLPVAGNRDELDRLAEAVNAMLARIEALMNGLKQVSDDIAHDLKTPLTRLRNRAEDALRSAAGDEAHKAALAGVIEESDGLIRTFNALLMIARAEAGGLEASMATLDLKDVAAGVVDLYEPLAEDAGIELAADLSPALVRGNRELLAQALSNLLDNALKHGSAEGRRGAVVVSLATNGREVFLTVADRGPGVPAADRERVLERFVRLEMSRTRPGSGLGLSLVAAVARLHRGAVRLLDNAPGLKVVITLPAESSLPTTPG